ncbi:helix-turn-helix domain-containing protein [Kitasatospora sp. NPDC002227]|uniref:TetR/AcrR family transcriptional regulator n=1 Tax=Kitasatospora sp. NPDC002227 TaxID=3154773 RepID=UPI00331C6E1D
MTDQDQVLGVHGVVPGRSQEAHGVVPEQRGPVDRYLAPGAAPTAVAVEPPAVPSRLRVDARRNLESVLRAARQVFGELGYDAPMEEVARRAGVGVGTVYRRFPSKEVLVQRIAAEEVAWLTAQARDSLYGNSGPWDALADYLARAVASGAGRLLPPSAFRYAEQLGTVADGAVPEQRLAEQQADLALAAGQFGGVPGYGGQQTATGVSRFGSDGFALQERTGLDRGVGERGLGEQVFGAGGSVLAPVERGSGAAAGAGSEQALPDEADPRLLLHLLAALVARAAAAGELRPGVTVADVVLVLTAAVPVHVAQARGHDGEPHHGPSAARPVVSAGGWEQPAGQPYDAPADRLLRILLQGLRAR